MGERERWKLERAVKTICSPLLEEEKEKRRKKVRKRARREKPSSLTTSCAESERVGRPRGAEGAREGGGLLRVITRIRLKADPVSLRYIFFPHVRDSGGATTDLGQSLIGF